MTLRLVTLLTAVLFVACSRSGNPVVLPDGSVDPCAGIDCSGQGTCAVVNGADGVCVCRAGFFAEGLECKAIVAGAECEGVSCGGRGTCVVLAGTPNLPKCECDAQSQAAGPTSCVPTPMPCQGITCGGHGTCAVTGTAPVCLCDAGFRANGTTCEAIVAGQECSGVTCSGHGQCAVLQGPSAAPLCRCETGYREVAGTTCVQVVDPCSAVTCSGRGQCAVTGGTTPVCVCNPGYVANSLACVLQGTVGGDLTLLAGALGGQGNTDGTVNTRFDSPDDVTHDAMGNVYVGGQSIRKITPSGIVSTIAGLAGLGNAGFVDGVGSAARFNNARLPVIDSAGNLFVVDEQRLRKVTPSGVVSTFLTISQLNFVIGMTIDANDNLWTSSFCGSGPCLSKVTPGGVVTSRTLTLAPGVTLPIVRPAQFSVSADGNTVFMTTSDGAGSSQQRGADVMTIDANTGSITRLLGIAPPGSAWQSTSLKGICLDGSNNLWLTDSTWGRIWRVPSTGGTATLIAGDASSVVTRGPISIDGPGASARFSSPAGLSCDPVAGKVYVADSGNHTIRAVAMGGNNLVTTIGGTPIALGAVDGTGGAARFRFPQQVVADSAGNWFVADAANAVIRKVTPAGAVSVFAGSFGMVGLTDGTGTAARFRGTDCLISFGCRIIGLAIDSSDNLYVADRGRRVGSTRQREPDALRRITPAGVVTTLASGNTVTPSAADTVYDQFDSLAVDGTNGDVYFNASDGVRRLRGGTISLVVSRPSGSGSGAIDGYFSLAVDSTRRKLFLCESELLLRRPVVRRYDLSGAMPILESTLTSQLAPALGAPGLGMVSQLAVAPNGALVAAFPNSDVILRVDPTFTRVDKIAGEYGARGVELGPLPARLSNPTGVAFNAAGQFGVVMGRASNSFGEGALLVTTGFTP
jgi:sugar lactone lactonase YvrE